MATAIRQTIQVQEEGKIVISSPQLHSGETAQVIVMLGSNRNRSPLAILDKLQQGLNLSSASANAWVRQIHDERLANHRDPAA